MQHKIDNRTGHAGDRRRKAAPMAPTPCANRRTGNVAREWGMRSRLRAHKTFEVQPGTGEAVALPALTPATCRLATRGPGAGDEKLGAERAQRAETHAALPGPPLPTVNARPASDRQHHLADMVGALELGMRAGGVLEREGLVDDGLDLARLEQWPDLFLETARHAALVLHALWPERRAGERQPIHHHYGGGGWGGGGPRGG